MPEANLKTCPLPAIRHAGPEVLEVTGRIPDVCLPARLQPLIDATQPISQPGRRLGDIIHDPGKIMHAAMMDEVHGAGNPCSGHHHAGKPTDQSQVHQFRKSTVPPHRRRHP